MGAIQGVGAGNFYLAAASTDVFVEYLFGFTSSAQTLINDHGSNAMEFSYDGVNVHGEILKQEALSFDRRYTMHIYIRSKVPGSAATFRLFAW